MVDIINRGGSIGIATSMNEPKIMRAENNEQHTGDRLFATSLSVTEDRHHATIHNIPPLLEHSFTPSELVQKLAGDVVVACGITFGIAPVMSVIDKSIVQRAAGTHTVSSSIASSLATMVQNPVAFVKSPAFLMMWGVYAATYTTGRLIYLFEFLNDCCSLGISFICSFAIFSNPLTLSFVALTLPRTLLCSQLFEDSSGTSTTSTE